AQAGAAFEAAIAVAKAGAAEPGIDLGLVEEICAAVVANGRGADAASLVETTRGDGTTPGLALCGAALLAAPQAARHRGVTDAAVDAELALAAAQWPSVALQIRRLERRARRPQDRAATAAEIEALIAASAGVDLAAIDRARLSFLYASLCEDDPGTRERAE